MQKVLLLKKAIVITFFASSLLLSSTACGSPPQTPEELSEAVKSSLKPNYDINVAVWESYVKGQWLVEAEYRPLLKESGPIEMEMMDAYKVIHTSELPVMEAAIIAYAELVDQYGNGSMEVIYRTEMDNVTATRVNWDKLYLVTPALVMNINYKHHSLR